MRPSSSLPKQRSSTKSIRIAGHSQQRADRNDGAALEGPRADLILIPVKQPGLSWQAVESVLQNRPVKPKIDELTMKVAFKDYGKLSVETAQRTLRFWQFTTNSRSRVSRPTTGSRPRRASTTATDYAS